MKGKYEDFFEAFVWRLHVDSQYVEAALKKKEEKKKDDAKGRKKDIGRMFLKKIFETEICLYVRGIVCNVVVLRCFPVLKRKELKSGEKSPFCATYELN